MGPLAYQAIALTEGGFVTPTHRIIAISGKQYAGKDVLTRFLLEALPDAQQVAIAQEIKRLYAEQHGLSLAEIEADKARHRPGLIALGDWGRSQDQDYWLIQALNRPLDEGKSIRILSDLRLKREDDYLKALGAFRIRLEASRSVRALRGQLVSEADPTECDLDAVTDWQACLHNDTSLSVLETLVKKELIPEISGFFQLS
jgi:phosphomevalonate kinase